MNAFAQHWTVDDVHKYISKLQIDSFKYNDSAEMFRKEMINGRLLLNLEKNDLNVLGIHQFAKRNALYQHLKALKSRICTKSISPVINSNTHNFLSTLHTNFDTNLQHTATSFSPHPKGHNVVLSTTMTPLILPQPSPVATVPYRKTIKVLQSSHCNGIASRARGNNMHSLSSFVNSINSPIYRSSFPQIPSPQSFSSNLFQNTISSKNNLLSTSFFSPNKQNTATFNGLQLNTNNNININHQENVNVSKRESIHPSIRRSSNELHLVEIPAIYQGVNSHNTAFLLMTQENIVELNKMYKQYNVTNNDRNIKSRNIFTTLQHFQCSIETEKVQYGWCLRMNGKEIKLPFNPLIRFKVNILTDEIMSIDALIINGHVNHINAYGKAWITSDLQIDAIEEVSAVPSTLISNIVSLKLINISHTSLQQRDASYMIHDPEHYNDYQWEKGLKIKFCLKLSTRTNKKNKNTRKPVFVQSWNVMPL